MGVVNRRFVALEFKKSRKDKPTKMQEYKLRKIREAGGIAIVVYPENWGMVYNYLLNLSKGVFDDYTTTPTHS